MAVLVGKPPIGQALEGRNLRESLGLWRERLPASRRNKGNPSTNLLFLWNFVSLRCPSPPFRAESKAVLSGPKRELYKHSTKLDESKRSFL